MPNVMAALQYIGGASVQTGGLGGLVKYWGGLSAEDGHPSQYYNRARRRVTSLIRPTMLPLSHAATYVVRRLMMISCCCCWWWW